MSKKKTALQWADENGACEEAIGWLNQHKNLTMEQAYAICSNVSWMWWALSEVLFTLSAERSSEIGTAMDEFEEDFFKESKCFDGIIGADKCLTPEQVSYWADRLRQYITPR